MALLNGSLYGTFLVCLLRKCFINTPIVLWHIFRDLENYIKNSENICQINTRNNTGTDRKPKKHFFFSGTTEESFSALKIFSQTALVAIKICFPK